MNYNKLWKILKEIGIPGHLIYLLKNLIQVKRQQLELNMEKWTGSKLGKEYGFILSLCLFNFYAEYIMRNARLDEAQL